MICEYILLAIVKWFKYRYLTQIILSDITHLFVHVLLCITNNSIKQ